MLERHGLRSQRRRSVDIVTVAKTNDLDALADQGLAPTSRGIGGPGLASAELMLIVNDPDRFPPCVALQVASATEYDKCAEKARAVTCRGRRRFAALSGTSL